MAEIEVRCVLGSKTVQIETNDQAAVTSLIEKVLKKTGNETRPPGDWTVRYGQTVLRHDQSLAAQHVPADATLVFTVGPAESGA